MTLITPQLALGNRDDPVRNGQYVQAYLCCAAEIPLPRNKPGHQIALKDGLAIEAALLDEAFRFLDGQLREKRLVLVYCGQGISRSPSVLAGYLASRSGKDLEDVLTTIRRLRPEISPSAATVKSIARYLTREPQD